MNSKSGIYQIINLINNKRYVGSAVDLKHRQFRHRNELRAGTHHNARLQNAWNKDGETSFEFRVVGKCSPENLIRLEQEVIDHLKPEYNIALVAGSSLGLKHTDEARSKMSIAKLGNSNALGHRLSDETKRVIGVAAQGNTNWLGKRHSDETKQKISLANSGRKLSEETIKKRSRRPVVA